MFRNRNEEALAHFAAIIESSEDAIVSKDLNGIIKSWNAGAERLFGYEAREVVGKSITIIIPTRLRSEEDEILSRIRSGKRISHFETIRQDKWGNEMDISLTISPIKDRKGRIIGAAKIARDISKQKHLERELQKTNDRKDEFLAILSHELRNPLAAIQGSLELLHHSEESLSKESLSIIERQTAHIVHLIDDLLDITRINQGKIKLKMQRLVLQDIINTAMESCHKLNMEKQHEIVLSLSQEPIYIEGDKTRILQIIINLVSNAIKYTPKAGIINITLEQNAENAYLKVQDNGIGIPPDKMENAFKMFHRLDFNSVSTDGLGVGLGITKQLVEMHGGSIELKENPQNPGCEFVVTFPLAAPPAQTEISEDANPTLTNRNGTSTKKRILIIDDNKDAVGVFQQILSLEGHDVMTALDGESGIEIATKFRPDLCLCDIGLPQMNGFQVAEHLRINVPETMLIALSGWGRPADVARSQEAGFSHHLVKSTDISEILAIINTIQSDDETTEKLCQDHGINAASRDESTFMTSQT